MHARRWSKAANQGCVVTGTGSYFRLIDSSITQRKAQGPSWTCNESTEVEARATLVYPAARQTRAQPEGIALQKYPEML